MPAPDTARPRLEKNLGLYLIYNTLFNGYFWGGVFFLYMLERLPMAQVLQLEAIYYLAVVAMEVPSGYFSDRMGRKPTLLIAALAFVIANTLFFFGRQFFDLAMAQIFMATGFAFFSGTSHSFLFDSLKSLGREDEFDQREAKAEGWASAFGATSCIIGGAVAMLELRYAYALSALTSVVCVFVVLMFREPVKSSDEVPDGFIEATKNCFVYLKNSRLAWLFTFMVFYVVVVHIPYQFYQPYIRLLDIDFGLVEDETPLLTGTLPAIGNFATALAAAYSVHLSRLFGLRGLLLVSFLVQTLVIFGLAVVLHPVMILLILLRNLPRGMIHAPYTAAVNEHLPAKHRATFFSINSLSGRLSFSLLLAGLSSLSTHQQNWQELSYLLRMSLVVTVVFLVVLWATRKSVSSS